MTIDKPDFKRVAIALTVPFVALVIQGAVWSLISPYVWFLFFPAVFFSSWIGGLVGGLASTVISIGLVLHFFMPLVPSVSMTDPRAYLSVGLFLGMGVLFSVVNSRLKDANRQLEEAGRQITRLYEKTRDLDEIKTRFFANVSHELRTPLALILGPLGRILTAPNLADDQRRSLDVMDRNARLLLRHVNDLLDIARLEAGRMSMAYSRTDMARLIRFVASNFESLADEKRIQYTVQTPQSLPAEVDLDKCRRVVLNLLSNAFKFTPAGGHIGVVLESDGAELVLRVQDSGPGIPADLREVVFERFRQVEDDAQRRHGGTGLGLAMVKEFVELHAGLVTLAEAADGGALFTVSLPLTAPPGTEFRYETPAPDDRPAFDRSITDELSGRHRTGMMAAESSEQGNAPLVLVVEDNPDMNAYIAETLGRRFRVVTAFDGEEGLARALGVHPDLIVCDVMMPRLSGDRMVEKLRKHQDMIDVPIIMLTAKADDELRIRLLSEGVQDYLSKPFSDEELLARVGRLIAEYRLVDRTRVELAAIVQSSDDAIIGKKLDGTITSWNPGAEKLFGYPAEGAIGHSIQMLFPPERIEEAKTIMARVAQGESIRTLDTVRIRQDGRAIDVSETISPIKNRQGAIIGAAKIARDTTARKRAEEEIRRLNTSLERRVKERTAELTAANEEVRNFAYIVSHDLRAPLVNIQGFCGELRFGVEQLRKELSDQSSTLPAEALGRVNAIIGEDLEEAMSFIEGATIKMDRQINAILKLSRLGHQPIRSESVGLEEIVHSAIDTLRHEIEAAGGRVTVGPLPSVVADRVSIEQMVGNLLSNAVKYRVPERAPALTVSADEAPDGVTFHFQDNGRGIAAHDIPRIFELFRRVGPQDTVGEGMGLSYVQTLVRRHEGRIWCDSILGEGTTFHVFLPRPKPADQQREQPS